MRNQHQQVCRTLTEMKEVIKKTPVATQVKLTGDLTNFSNAYQVDVEVDFTWTNERELCGPIEDSKLLAFTRDGYSFGLPRGEEVWSGREWAPPLLHPTNSGLESSVEEIFFFPENLGPRRRTILQVSR
ncbi:hypothetical protein OROMI_016243 [Orobanche minor]